MEPFFDFFWHHSWWLLALDFFFIVNLVLVVSTCRFPLSNGARYACYGKRLLCAWPLLATVIIWVDFISVSRGLGDFKGQEAIEIGATFVWLAPLGITLAVLGSVGFAARLVPWGSGAIGSEGPKPWAKTENYAPKLLLLGAVVTVNLMRMSVLPFADLSHGRALLEGPLASSGQEFKDMLKALGPYSVVSLLLNFVAAFVWIEGVLQLHENLHDDDVPDHHHRRRRRRRHRHHSTTIRAGRGLSLLPTATAQNPQPPIIEPGFWHTSDPHAPRGFSHTIAPRVRSPGPSRHHPRSGSRAHDVRSGTRSPNAGSSTASSAVEVPDEIAAVTDLELDLGPNLGRPEACFVPKHAVSELLGEWDAANSGKMFREGDVRQSARSAIREPTPPLPQASVEVSIEAADATQLTPRSSEDANGSDVSMTPMLPRTGTDPAMDETRADAGVSFAKADI
ncbi:MAG: hypothetical protein M1832_001448 [Thelocarpon impressellum]|nr:MAG: hypothetical protein M1832_001448 [Thelocarpon impressellum]